MTTTTIRTNKFAANCAACGGRVQAGAGALDRNAAGAWEVRHYGEDAEACLANQEAREAAPAPARIAIEDAGVYVMPDGSVVRVKANQAKTRTYASRWVTIGGVRVTEAGTFENGDYEYVPGLVNRVAEVGRKMTADEAQAFVVRYGRCVRCNRHLKDANSVLAAMGPQCRRYFSL
jgi:hypothetical protein